MIGLDLFGMYTVVANVGSTGHYYLTGVGWIGVDFLIAGHTGIKANFTAVSTGFANEGAVEDRSISQKKCCFLFDHFLENCPKLTNSWEGG